MRILVLIFLLIQFGTAQERIFRRYTVEDGLSQNSVYDIVQDSVGYLWFATADGINRFDGYSFSIFRPVPGDPASIQSTFSRRLLRTGDDDLMISQDVGISLYHQRENRFEQLPLLIEPVPSRDIYGMCIDSSHQFWYVTLTGVFRSERAGAPVSRIPILRRDGTLAGAVECFSVFCDSFGTVWLASVAGVFTFDARRGVFVPFHKITEDVMRCFAEDEAGNLFIGNGNGIVFRVSRNREGVRSYSSEIFGADRQKRNNITALKIDKQGMVWIGTYESGLFAFDTARMTSEHFLHDPAQPSSIGFDIIRSLCIDNNSNLWIGTDGGGVSVTSLEPKQFHTIDHRPGKKHSLGGNFVKGVYQDRHGIVWIGSNEGLNRYDPRTDSCTLFVPYPELQNVSGNQVYAVTEAEDGIIWLSTVFGVSSFDPVKRRFTHFPGLSTLTNLQRPVVSSFIWNSDTTLYLATQGVVTFNIRTGRYSRESIFADKISSFLVFNIYRDSRGTIWVSSTQNGLLRIDPLNGMMTQYMPNGEDQNSISAPGIRGLYEAPEGILWIGTTNGLNRFDERAGTFTRYFEKDGLPNSFVYGILPDGHGNLWLSTNRGLSRFDPEKRTFRNYSPFDGLQSWEFNTGAFYRNPGNGMLFFGGVKGVTYFHPDSIHDSRFSPPIVLTDLKKFDQSIVQSVPFQYLDEIVLPYNENTVTFSFAAMDFAGPKHVRYVYRLEGFEQEWINAGTRRDVRYTNLNDGEYLFRVRATNADGILGTKELVVRLVIIPPVWKRWWFIVAMSMLSAAAAAGILRWYFSRRIKKQMERYERERERLEERMKTRDKIARDLHDDLASTVGSAGFYVETAKRTLSENAAQSREYLEKTSAILIEAEEAMSDIVWSVSPKNDTVQSLITRIRVVTADLCRANGIGSSVEVNGNTDMPLSDEVRRGFYLIFKEVLNNALKHSKASMITLRITIENDRLLLIIRDNGSGFDTAYPKESLGGNGIQNIRQRAAEIRAELRFDSVIGSGTTVTVEKQLTQLGH